MKSRYNSNDCFTASAANMRDPQPAEEWHDVGANCLRRPSAAGPAGDFARAGAGLARDASGRESPLSLTTYLKGFYAGHPAPVFEAPASIGGRFFYNDTLDGFNFESKRALLGEVLDRLCHGLGNAASPALYAGSVSLPIYLPGFSAATMLATWSPSSRCSNRSGLETARVLRRISTTPKLGLCVGGRRRFTMFPPDQIKNLYVGPLDLTPAGQPVSLVDVRNPDLVRFPRFAEAAAVAVVAELEPGDAVYIPALWWHNVEALEDFNVLVNYWWRDVPITLSRRRKPLALPVDPEKFAADAAARLEGHL